MEKLEENSMRKLAVMLRNAFSNDPLFTFAFGDNFKAMDEYFYRSLDACRQQGGVVVAPNGDGVLAWVSSSHFPAVVNEQNLSLDELNAFHRFKLHEAAPERIISKNAKNYTYFWLLGVAASSRGKGYARLLIEQAVQQATERGFEECWLSTEKDTNKAFYQKLGFRLVEEVKTDAGLMSYVFKKHL